MSRTGGPAASKLHHPGASNSHHPVASRHPSSTRRGMRLTLPSSLRRAGRDNVADRWSCGVKTTPPRRFEFTPPHRFAPPLLHEEGNAVDFALLVEEGRTRQCRGQVVSRRPNDTTPALRIHTTPSLRATPPPRGGECG